jgi:hypothetical protein
MSNEPTIEQKNVELAKFEGRLFHGYPIEKFGTNRFNELPVMKYHKSWDWLKPVIDEIFKYALAYPEQVKPIIDMSIVVDIKAAHEKVFQFIQWYNKPQTNTNEITP